MVVNLVAVSANSSSGTESATMPPPAYAVIPVPSASMAGAADRDHPLTVAALVAPPERAGVEAAVAFECADRLVCVAGGVPQIAGVG